MEDFEQFNVGLNRYNNAMAIVINDFNGKINNFCQKVDIPYLANFLNHKRMPKRTIGDTAARKIEEVCSLPVGSLDQAYTVVVNTLQEQLITRTHVQQMRFDSICLLNEVLAQGNASKLSRILGVNITPYLGKNPTRNLGNQVTRKIEANLELEPFSLDNPLDLQSVLFGIEESELMDIKSYLTSEFSALYDHLTVLNETQNACIADYLDNILKLYCDSTALEMLAADDIRRVNLPFDSPEPGIVPVLFDAANSTYKTVSIEGIPNDFRVNLLCSSVLSLSLDGRVHELIEKICLNPLKEETLKDLGLNGRLHEQAARLTYTLNSKLENTLDNYLNTRSACRTAFNMLSEVMAFDLISDLQNNPHYISVKKTLVDGFAMHWLTLVCDLKVIEALVLPISPEMVKARHFRNMVRKLLDHTPNLHLYFNQHPDVSSPFVPAKQWLEWVSG